MASGDSSFVSRVTDSEDQDRNDSIFGDHQDSSTVQTVENVGEGELFMESCVAIKS